MRRRTFALLATMLAFTGCTAMGSGPGSYGGGPVRLGNGAGGAPDTPTAAVALLIPLSGPRAEIGLALQRAAELAVSYPGSPKLDVRDTTGTPQGAAQAAQAAVAAGDAMILGPLTSTETAAVATVASAANVPVLAFTNDSTQARPGIWTLGITPRQQVSRLVAAARAQGKGQFAALLPDNDFGRAMGNALQEATTEAGLPPPRIQSHASGMKAIMSAMREVSDFTARGGSDSRSSPGSDADKAAGDTTGQHNSLSPPPFDALLLADVGEPLAEIASLFSYVDISTNSVRVLGPGLWGDPASRSGQLPGAWYAAPDPAARNAFNDAYTAKFGSPPRAIADIAYDAASIARVLAQSGGFTIQNLTQPAGFAGTDGLLALQPDGRVRRALAVFEIKGGGAPSQIVDPAPQAFTAPGA